MTGPWYAIPRFSLSRRAFVRSIPTVRFALTSGTRWPFSVRSISDPSSCPTKLMCTAAPDNTQGSSEYAKKMSPDFLIRSKTRRLAPLRMACVARRPLERRYLDDRPALFPDAASDWGALREQAEGLAGLGGSLAVSPNDRTRRRGRPELHLDALRRAARALAPTRTAGLADLARAAALDLLGDAEGAAAIAERRLRVEPRHTEAP